MRRRSPSRGKPAKVGGMPVTSNYFFYGDPVIAPINAGFHNSPMYVSVPPTSSYHRGAISKTQPNAFKSSDQHSAKNAFFEEESYSGRTPSVRKLSYPQQGMSTQREQHAFGGQGQLPQRLRTDSFETPADHYITYCYNEQKMIKPPEFSEECQWDDLSKDLWSKYLTHRLTANRYREKLLFWRRLCLFFQEHCPNYSLFLIGSTMSGLGSNDSDVDLCLIIDENQNDIERNVALYHLNTIASMLMRLDDIKVVDIVQAKVPILKFRESNLKFDAEISCSSSVAIRNTHLLCCYSKLDWRVRPLVVVVKQWAAVHQINNAKANTLSSYSLTLMVIYFLQSGVSPPVIPCLSYKYSSKFSVQRDVFTINMNEAEDVMFNSENGQSLGELFIGFLKFYDTFDFALHALSVRIAATIPIKECRKVCNGKNEAYRWGFLCIEEPFHLTNVSYSVHEPNAFFRIKSVINESYTTLSNTRDLKSIF